MKITIDVPDELHQDTQVLIGTFATALAAKLRRAEVKYGYGNAWLRRDWEARCRADIRRHLEKGDPLDVAAYAAFMWYHAWSTKGESG
jgi:hypothetical protein